MQLIGNGLILIHNVFTRNTVVISIHMNPRGYGSLENKKDKETKLHTSYDGYSYINCEETNSNFLWFCLQMYFSSWNYKKVPLKGK